MTTSGDGFSIDASEVVALARTLTASNLIVTVGSVAVLKKGALNIKKDAKKRASGHRHAPAYPSSIVFEGPTVLLGGAVEAEIGPDTDRPQWGLGDILEFGTPRTAPHPHLMPALQAELPNVERYLLELSQKALP